MERHRARIGDRLIGFALIGVVDVVVGGAIVAVSGPPPAAAWPFIVVSYAVHVVYNLFLLLSYQLGDFSQTYPLARGPALPMLALLRRRGHFLSRMRRHLVPGLLGGVISFAAYSIVLWAQTSGMLAAVAALREGSIVFGAVIGAVFFGERLGHRRTAMAVVVLLGVIVLA